MEFPPGHHSHSHSHHHKQRDDDDDDDNYEEKREDNYNYPPPGRTTIPGFDDQPPPPPRPHSYYQEDELPPPPRPHSYYQEDEQPPPPRPHSYYQEDEMPPPPPTHLSHTYHAPPPPQEYGYSAYPSESAPPPPIYSSSTHVEHVAYDVNPSEVEAETHHSHRPHLPSFLHHQTPQNPTSDLYNKPTYKIFSKAEPNFSLTNRDGHVILTPSDPSDEFQHWYKDEKYSTRVKDEEGFPCFALVNKATGQAIKHSIGASHPVQLIPYNADALDESILWTQGKDLGDGFRTVRMVNNIRLNVDAFHGDKKSGGVHDGTTIVLWEWNKGDNQRWKIIPYCKFL